MTTERDWLGAMRIWDGGLGIWGAVALGGVGAWIGCRGKGIPLPAFGDAIAPGIILAQAIGRLGNYFNQELYGRPTTLPWGLEIYERRDVNGALDSLNGVSTGQLVGVVHPTFLYELLWNVLVFAALIWIDRRFKIGHGRLFAMYVAGYCVGRFWIELMRSDHASMPVDGIRVNSFTSTFVFIGAVVYIMVAPKGREDPASLAGNAEKVDEEEDAVEAFAKELTAVAATTGVVAAAKVAGDAEDEDAKAAVEDEEDVTDEPEDEDVDVTDEPEDEEPDAEAEAEDEVAAEIAIAAEDLAPDVAGVPAEDEPESDAEEPEAEDEAEESEAEEPEAPEAEAEDAEPEAEGEEAEDQAEEPEDEAEAEPADEGEEAVAEPEAEDEGSEAEAEAADEAEADDEDDALERDESETEDAEAAVEADEAEPSEEEAAEEAEAVVEEADSAADEEPTTGVLETAAEPESKSEPAAPAQEAGGRLSRWLRRSR